MSKKLSNKTLEELTGKAVISKIDREYETGVSKFGDIRKLYKKYLEHVYNGQEMNIPLFIKVLVKYEDYIDKKIL